MAYENFKHSINKPKSFYKQILATLLKTTSNPCFKSSPAECPTDCILKVVSHVQAKYTIPIRTFVKTVKVESKLIKELRKRRLSRNYLVAMITRLKPYNADGFKTSMGPNEPLNMR